PSPPWVCGAEELSIARRPCSQSALSRCMCLGACKVPIFSSSTTATRPGGPFFSIVRSANPN
ncbi:hypothetical protein C8R46DRAFT_860888, partial [Mycena filopes]